MTFGGAANAYATPQEPSARVVSVVAVQEENRDVGQEHVLSPEPVAFGEQFAQLDVADDVVAVFAGVQSQYQYLYWRICLRIFGIGVTYAIPVVERYVD